MIRGVNKRVIEVTNTKSPYFEKAILILKPEKAHTSDVELKSQADRYMSSLDGFGNPSTPYHGGGGCALQAKTPVIQKIKKRSLGQRVLLGMVKFVAAAGVGAGIVTMIFLL